jgi:LacI family transcriptional regulator
VSEETVGYLATRHLIEQGCRKIGHIRVSSMEERFKGFERAMNEFGLSLDPGLIFDAGNLRFSICAGEAFASKVVQEGIAMDGLVAESDTQAAGALNVFMHSGIRIPQEIKVIGVDDSPFCEYFPIPISSVSQRHETRGRKAIEMLMRLQKKARPEHCIVEPIIKPRASSATTG